MEIEGSLPYSEDTTADTCLQPHELTFYSSYYSIIYFFVYQMVSFLEVFRLNTLQEFLIHLMHAYVR
jgi:hypothetical protein